MDSSFLPKTLFKFILHFLKKWWIWILFIQLFSFAWSLDHTLWPYIMMRFIDIISNYVGDKAYVWQALSVPIMMGAGLWISLEICFRLSGILAAYTFPRIEAETRMQMFNYVLHHSYLYFGNKMSGSLANKISDMSQSMTRLLQLIIHLFIPVGLALVISATFFAFIQPLFAVILVIWVTAHLSVCLFFARKCDNYSNIHAESRSELSGKIVDSLTNSSNVRLFARQKYEYSYVSRFQADELQKHWLSLWYVEKMKIVLGIVCFLGAGVAINWYMFYSWQQGRLTTGEVVFIFNTMWNINIMAWLAGLELPNLFKEIGICRQALTIIQDPHDLVDQPNALPLQVTGGEIVFNQVSFRYKQGQNIFQDKTIVIKAGQKVGLVGFSGSGKTTFVNLILRYFDIDRGHILIDGQDIREVTQESLRSQISTIPQEPILFHRTIMENIRYGNLYATDEEVIEAAKKAHCHEFIMKLPEQYNFLVGERGVKLSGGQRQRIAIARVILKDVRILVLDEATSALDSATEKDIQAGLTIAMKGRTALVIAHRFSTVMGMDRILVFKDGKIVEDGTHQTLLHSNSYYAHLWNMQNAGFLPENEKNRSQI